MRKMLNTLFVTTEDAYLSLENENIVVHVGEEKRAQYPLLMLEGILTFSYKGASPALMGACAERGIGLTFLTPRGRFLARVCGSERGNVLLRREQYRRADSLSASCLIARNFIFGKVYNQRWVLERTIRDHALRVNVQALKDVSAALDAKLPQIESAVDLDVLRGLEGDASADYFSVFDEMILTQKAVFLLTGRNRRPPQDNMNALLSFAYVLLANDCAAALESVGLDAYVGFMHRDRPGRTSLALDLMEELRAPMADRLCITLVNNRVLQDKRRLLERCRAQAVLDRVAKPQTRRNHPPVPERKNHVGACSLCTGTAACAHPPRRHRRLSPIPLEITRKRGVPDAGSNHLRCFHRRCRRQTPLAASRQALRRPRSARAEFRI